MGCLILFVNSIVWHNNTVDWAPICYAHVISAVAIGIPAASLCINRRLYNIAAGDRVSISRAHKRRAVFIDLAIGLGLPLLQLPLRFVVQGHRYDILEDVGCFITTVNTPPAYPLSFIWPNVIGLISAVYCVLTIRAFMRRRAQFTQFVTSNNSLTVNRYFRLMSLATLELVFNMPISAYVLYTNLTGRPIYHWKSWADTHFDFFTIDIYPATVWRSNKNQTIAIELNRWLLILCAFIFFGFFGFAEEARKNYRLAFWAVAQCFGLKPAPVPPPYSSAERKTPQSFPYTKSGASLPVFNTKSSSEQPSTKRDTHSSISDRTTSYCKSDYTASIYQSPMLPDYRQTDIPLPPITPVSSSFSNDFSDMELQLKQPLPVHAAFH